LPRRLTYVRFAIEHTADGLEGNTRFTRHIDDGCRAADMRVDGRSPE